MVDRHHYCYFFFKLREIARKLVFTSVLYANSLLFFFNEHSVVVYFSVVLPWKNVNEMYKDTILCVRSSNVYVLC